MKTLFLFFALIQIQFLGCSNTDDKIISFEIKISDPLEFGLQNFEIQYLDAKFYIKITSYIEEDIIKQMIITKEEKKSLLSKINNFDELIVPTKIEEIGENEITDKIRIRLYVNYLDKEKKEYDMYVMRCFEGYSNEFYELYLLLRTFASLSKPNCER